MPRRAKVVSDPSLERDLTSNAVVRRDAAAYQARIQHKRIAGQQRDVIDKLQKQINDLVEAVGVLRKKVENR